MKRNAWLWMGCLFGVLPLSAQENVKEEYGQPVSESARGVGSR